MHTTGSSVGRRPRISVIMANFEGGDKIVPALQSVLGQTMADLEVIVSDDASEDNSLTVICAMMAADPRIRLSASDTNRGPAHCRNRALDLARGEWVAVVDSDDIIHPERFDRLLAAAAQHEADIIADNLLLFFADGSPPSLMLGAEAAGSFAVSPRDWVLAGLEGSPALGYLKPLIRADRLGALRYDEGLRIGEDYDFVLRLLLTDARMVVVREPFYLYRRHAASISHRLSVPDMQAMVERQAALATAQQPLSAELSAAFAKRLSALTSGLSYERLVAGIKQGQPVLALRLLAEEPAHLGRLWRSFVERRRRPTGPDAAAPRPASIALGGRGAIDADLVVPDYVPTHAVDWSAHRPASPWLALAAHAGGHCVALDQAGHYAAGFIPEAKLELRPALQAAS